MATYNNNDNVEVRNIYIMLCYAFECIKDKVPPQIQNVQLVETIESIDLMAFILNNNLSILLKTGLMSRYKPIHESSYFVRGKINTKTYSSLDYIVKRKFMCEYDEFTLDVLENQIIKIAIKMLLKNNDLKGPIKHQLRKKYAALCSVSDIEKRSINWRKIYLDKLSIHYRFILATCYLIIESSMMDPNDGIVEFKGIDLDSLPIPKIFEKFVLNYIKSNFGHLNVEGNKTLKCNDDNTPYLGKMELDIMIEGDNDILIIDTKYYKKILTDNNLASIARYKREHIYQLNAYVENMLLTQSQQPKPKQVKGILLYAKTKKEVLEDKMFLFNGKQLGVYTLDLDQEWDALANSIDEIVHDFFE